ncbi:MAG: lipid-A-disaccharide synthase [Caulobacteraceae bacterium]|nr:lipid-A-disaccharide synthase [Caulobacteraceae bacterium]
MKPLTVMLVAAEASGDERGAGLISALRRRLGEQVRFIGVGGPRMAELGVASPFDIAELSILGFFDGLMAYGRVKRRVADTVALAEQERPDVAVLIDSWGFTVRVAKALRAAMPQVALVKYVGPQVFAARPGRAKTLAQAVDQLLTIHSFDAPFFEREGLATTFVGNSALMTDFRSASGERFRKSIGAGKDDRVLLVLPGSRPSEVRRLTPAFEGTIRKLRAADPRLHVAVVAADTVADFVRGWVAGLPFRAHLIEGDGPKHDAMLGSTVALACSGTVSIELALAGLPMVIAYRLDPLTYAIAMHMVRTPWITLFNIAARDRIAPEFVQGDANPDTLAAAVARRLEDPALRRRQVERQNEALDLMGRGLGDPSDKAAEAILALMASRA